MGVRPRRALLATTLLSALVATACGTEPAASGETTLIVKTFSQFGYDELYKEYEASHPGVTIKEENIGKLGDYTPKLQQWLATGKGAGDVVAIEEGILSQFIAKPDQFVNLLDHGAGELKGNFLPWKWQQASTSDGGKVDRPRHGRRRAGHVLPHRPVRQGGPAHRPRGGREAVAHLGELPGDRQEVQGRGHRRRVLRRLRQPVPEHPDAAG